MGAIPVRLMVVENLVLLRAALVSVLSAEEGFSVVGALSCVDALDGHDVDVAVVGVDTTGDECLAVVRALAEARPLCRVIAMSVPSAAGVSRELLALGVPGLVDKHESADHLVRAIRTVAGGGRAIDATLANGREARPNPFTSRERQVLRCAATGATATEIADQLGLAPGTVRNYLASAMTKTSSSTRIDVIRVAERSGWL